MISAARAGGRFRSAGGWKISPIASAPARAAASASSTRPMPQIFTRVRCTQTMLSGSRWTIKFGRQRSQARSIVGWLGLPLSQCIMRPEGNAARWRRDAMPGRYTFPKSRRLSQRADFAAVYDAKVRDARGPVVVYALPNALGHPRLGLSTSRKVGTAARRNRIRRLLREAFRHLQHDMPAAYDLLIVIRPHEPLKAVEYQDLLKSMVLRLHSLWGRRKQ
jgi:ribonuclease P protein component